MTVRTAPLALVCGLALLVAAACTRSGASGDGTSGDGAHGAATSAAASALLAQLPPPYAHADLANGELHLHLCLSCHTIDKGGPDMTGPNLYGVFGRRVGTRPDFAYSAVLKSKTWIWDAAHMDGWLKDPRSYVPGTKMTFYGLRDDKDRLDTIAYLKVVTGG